LEATGQDFYEEIGSILVFGKKLLKEAKKCCKGIGRWWNSQPLSVAHEPVRLYQPPNLRSGLAEMEIAVKVKEGRGQWACPHVSIPEDENRLSRG
jgi:hypothetical protein